MTKEEFIKKVNELRSQKVQIEKEYIRTNTKYEDGTRLKVTSEGKTRYGIVRFSVVEDDEVVPYVTLIMKNGDESKRRLCIYPEDIVEIG